MSDGAVRLARDGSVAEVVFDRPKAHNAMTWAMYDALVDVCHALAADRSVRVVTFAGAGGKAFVAGTDISQFTEMDGAEAGLAYERRIDACIDLIERLPQPTVAVIEGWAVGGGLAIATACDVRIGTPAARFGVPIARTVGNCLSMANTARLVAAFGAARAKRMLLVGDMIGADEARACGFLADVLQPEALEARLVELTDRLRRNAPVTMRVAKEMIRRLLATEVSGGEDLIANAYGSDDFRTGVAAFVEKRAPVWQGH